MGKTVGNLDKSVKTSLDNDFAAKSHTHNYAAPSHTHTIANITDLRIKNGAAGITTGDPYQSWAHNDIKNNDIAFGGNYSGHTTTDANIVFASGSGKINMVIDGEYYAAEGKQRVYHTGYKPSPSDIGAAASSHGTHVTWSTTAPKVAGTAAVGTETKVARGDHVHAAQTSVSGNAGTATKLKTARTLTIGNTGKSFDGSANVSWTLDDIGAVARYTATGNIGAAGKYFTIFEIADQYYGEKNNYLLSINRTYNSPNNESYIFLIVGAYQKVNITQLASKVNSQLLEEVRVVMNTTNASSTKISKIEVKLKDNPSYTNAWYATLTPLSYNARVPVCHNFAESDNTGTTIATLAPTTNGMKLSEGGFNGNASTASSAAKWTTARTLTIGNTGKSVNGSANVSWSLSEIGAAAASHSHTFIGSIDTRNTNPDPNTYTLRGITPEFKSASGIGLPNVGSNYAGTLTYQQWADVTNWSGGKTTQFATIDDGRMYYRKGDGSGWGSWYQFYTTQNKPTYSDVGAAAASHGTHVTWSTTAPKVAGTASVGTETKVARGDHVHAAQTSVSGNAGTATKLATARTLTIGSKGKTFDGSANVSWTLSEIGAAAASHTHNVLSVKNDNFKKASDLPSTYERGETLFFSNNQSGTDAFNGLTYGLVQTLKEYSSGPAAWQFLYPYNAATDTFYVRNAQYNTDSWRSWAEVYTSLNKPSPADIGAAASSHTHAYLPTAGGTMTGAIKRTSFPATWVAAMTNSLITSTHGTAGGFQPMFAGKTTNGSMCLALYQKTLQAAYITKANVDAGTNTTAKTAILMDESGNGSWTGSVTATGGFTSGGNVVSDTALTDNVGSAAKPWKNMYNRYYNLYGEASKSYGNFFVQTVGTTSATGEARLTLGNNIATGTASNAYGRLLLYGTNTGYTIVTPGNNSTSNITVTLPSSGGTLARTADNVASATKLKTARTLTIGSKGKTFDGSADVSWTLAEIGAAASSHNHDKIVAASGSAWTTAVQNPSAGNILFHYNVSKSATGLFPNTNNANLIISLNRHSGNYSCQLGFNNEGNIYYRGENNVAISDSMKWKEIAFNGRDSSLVDAITVGRSGSGTSTADTYASTGKCYKFTSTSTATTIYKCTFAPLHFGSYGLCVRLKAGANTSTSNIVQIIVRRGTKALKTVSIKGTQFTSTSQYQNFYTNIDYVGDGSAKVDLSVEIKSTTVSGIALSFDYARIEMMNTGVFL